MGRANNTVAIEQDVLGRGLNLEDIQCYATDGTCLEGFGEVLLDNQTAAGTIDNQDTGPGLGQRF